MIQFIAMSKAVVVENFRPIAEIWVNLLKQLGLDEVEIMDGSFDPTEKILQMHPEIVLMDINLDNGLNGLDLTKKLTEQSELKICVISLNTGERYVSMAKDAGARAYICKSSPITEIRSYIERVLQGEFCYSH